MRRPALLALFALPLLSAAPAQATITPPCEITTAGQALLPSLGTTGSPLSITFDRDSSLARESVQGGMWDHFGELAIGSGREDYTATAVENCGGSTDGRELTYPVKVLDGVQVQRRIFVASSAVSGSRGHGVRFLDTVTNPGAAPVTTQVWVGDLSTVNTGGLDSDDVANLRGTSSGDQALSTADRWAVTSDAKSPTNSNDLLMYSSPALAHVWGGDDAPQSADLVRFGGAGDLSVTDDSTPLEPRQLGWAWRNVTLQPGESASFLSWEIPAITDTHTYQTQSAAAADAAADLSTDPATLLQRLTPTQIKQIRNWEPPEVEGQIAPVTGASTGVDTVLTAREVDFGVGVSQCNSGTYTWNFGDGATATGGVVSHRFAAGEAEVTLTIDSACGGRRVRTARFAVADAPAEQPTSPGTPQASEPAPLRVFGPPSIQTTTLAGKGGLAVTVIATVDGTVRMVLTGRGVKSVTTVKVKAGQAQVVRVRLDRSARPAALKLSSIRLRSKLTPTGGGEETIDNLYLALKK